MTRRDDSLPRLDGRVALVTGAGGGIGAGIARQLSAAGAAVMLAYRASARPAEALADALRADGGQATTVAADITNPDACADMVAATVAHFGRLDVLVNNAGLQPIQDLESMTTAQFREVLDANVTGTFNATQAAVAVMRDEGGSIIHIASIEGSHPAAAHSHYCASKAAVIMHAKTAALEYGRLGIRVNCVSPGLIARDGLAEAWPDGVQRWRGAAPLGRLGEATDIGNACVFLASPMASWVTGVNLVVDGGVSVHPTW